MTTLAELILKADYRQIDGANDSMGRLVSTGDKAVGMVGRLAGALGVAFGVREIVQAAEAYTTINNRLSLVTDSSEELAAAQQDVFDIAQRTRSPLKETAEVYQRLATNADQLGMSLGEVGKTTETINKLMVISGTSGESAAAALTQLGQAFASGTLRGEELNSVMEQAPALAKAIADGMGVTVGQLRNLGQEGKITASAVVDALKNQSDAVTEQFGKMAPTIGQSLAQAQNSFINFVGKVDAVTGASKAVAQAITGISESLDGEWLSESTRLFVTWGATFKDASTNAAPLASELNDVAFGAKAIGWYIKEAFITLPANVKAMTGIAAVWVADFIESTSNRFTRAKERWNAIWTDDTWEAANQRYKDRAKILQETSESSISAILAQRDAEIQAGEAAAKASGNAPAMDILNKGGGAAAQTVDESKKSKSVDLRVIENQALMQADVDAQMERRAWLESEFATEREAELLRYEQRLADFAEYKKAFGLIDEDAEAKAKRLTIEQEHQDKLTAIEQAAQAKKTANMRQGLGILAGLMTTNSRKLFEIGKAAAIANALIDAKESVVSAYAFGSRTGGPILGAVFAAAAAAAQAANISSIASQQFGGGGTVSAAGGSSVSAPDTSNISNQQSAPVRSQVVDIRIQGRGLWRDEDVAELMEAMGDRLKDGAKFGRVEFVRS